VSHTGIQPVSHTGIQPEPMPARRLSFPARPKPPRAPALRSIGLLSLLLVACRSPTPPPSPVPPSVGPPPLTDPLLAPVPTGPPPGQVFLFAAADRPPQVRFEWRHAMPTARVPNPHQAERFILCVYDKGRGRCESGVRAGVPPPIWFEADADDPVLERAPILPKRVPFAAPLPIHLGHTFGTRLSMLPAYRDRELWWQVGACRSGTCRMSDPRSLRMYGPAKPDAGPKADP